MKNIHAEKVLILDFGSQYTQLIARRVRELKVFCEIVPHNISIDRIRAPDVRGLIFSGGPASVYDGEAPTLDRAVIELDLPVLGICYGMQLMAQLLGGGVEKSEKREYGQATMYLAENSPLMKGLAGGEHQAEDGGFSVWMSHGDRLGSLPPCFRAVARTENSEYAAVMDDRGRLFGLQFHPEVKHTPAGMVILKNFLYEICRCDPTWDMRSYVDYEVEVIREMVGRKEVLCALSGGVDSSVTATIVHRAVGDRLTCIFVNNGLLRKGEAEEVIHLYKDQLHLNLRYVDAEDRFLRELQGVIDPEEKRKIIGREFIYLFQEEASRLGRFEFLAQGTLYPDVIESVSVKGPSATIKTHHNVGGLPDGMEFTLVEPLRELFKDEVRRLGAELGLPREILWRQPFPGPGLAVRIIGEVNRESLEIVREADAVIREEVHRSGLDAQLWQFFAVLLPVRTVGVMGDFRTYEKVIVVRAVESADGMTADWARLPGGLLGEISNRIINEVRGVNRVVYDISSKPPGTIEWE